MARTVRLVDEIPPSRRLDFSPDFYLASNQWLLLLFLFELELRHLLLQWRAKHNWELKTRNLPRNWRNRKWINFWRCDAAVFRFLSDTDVDLNAGSKQIILTSLLSPDFLCAGCRILLLTIGARTVTKFEFLWFNKPHRWRVVDEPSVSTE